MVRKHLTPQQRKAIPDLLKYALFLKGKTITMLEKESNKQYLNDKNQEMYRNQEIWHRKEDLDKYVATRLHLSDTLYGSNKISPDFITCTTNQLVNLCKNGIITRWNQQKHYQIFRLNDLTKEIKNPTMQLSESNTQATYNYNNTSDSKFNEIFLSIISKGRKDNTYKFALGKILLDYCYETIDKEQDQYIISYDYLSKEFFKHYWHQRYKFNIKQDPHTKKQPVVISALEDEFRQSSIGNFEQLDQNKVKNATKNIRKKVFGHAKNKSQMVISKFQNIPYGASTENVPIFYDYDDEKGFLYLKKDAFNFFKKNYGLLSRALLAEWTRQLEQFNYSLPKLVAKIDFENAIRTSLSPYRKLFEPYMDHCFYCCTKLEQNYVHVDNLIPWSYIFADEAWNLVLACQKCNLRKHDSLPQEEFRDELIFRNRRYYEQLSILKRSLDQLNTGKGWVPEIKNHYQNCQECGFGKICMP